MSTYQKFLKAVEEDMIQFLPEELKDCQIRIDTISKNNGTQLEGVVITRKGHAICPTLYLKSFYERYQRGEEFERVLNEIVDAYVNAERSFSEEFTNYLRVENVILTLVNKERNEELLKTIPFQTCSYSNELVYIFRVLISKEAFATMVVTNKLMDACGWETDSLYQAALENTPTLLPLKLDSMDSMLSELELYCEQEVPNVMYIVSNEERTFGACAIFYPEVLNKLCNLLQSESIVILPSSVHETIVLPFETVQLEELKTMVRQVNEGVVSPEEYLGEQVVVYHKK